MAQPARVGRPRKDPRPIGREPRDELLAAASHLFSTKGVAGTTMRELAREAGLHPSSIYYYFDSKEAIVRAMVTEINQVFFDELDRIGAAGGSAGVRLHRLIRRDVELLCRLPYDLNEALRIAELQEDEFHFFWADRERLHDAVERIVAEGVDSGEFVPVDTRLAALAVLANDKGVQSWYRPIGDQHLASRRDEASDYSPEEIGRFLADLTVGGLLRDRTAIDAIRELATALASHDLDAG